MEDSQQENPKAHILVVEDEVNLAVGMRYSLEHENYRVTLIHDGAEALKAILRNAADFDAIILDIMLPNLNGYSICSMIREQGVLTPIMFLSARTLPEDKARGFDVGANQYLAKPFELEEFLARIRNMVKLKGLQSSQKSPVSASHTGQASENPSLEKTNGKDSAEVKLPDRMKIGQADIHFDTMEVNVQNETLHLTFLEVSLLKYFVLNANRLISKEELLENVWKMPAGMNTRAPDQFILRLRKIVEPNPAKPVFLLTVRNAGYRFLPNGK